MREHGLCDAQTMRIKTAQTILAVSILLSCAGKKNPVFENELKSLDLTRGDICLGAVPITADSGTVAFGLSCFRKSKNEF